MFCMAQEGVPIHGRVKSYLIFLFLFIFLLFTIAGFLFFTGIKDLQDDENILIIAVDNGDAIAATNYNLKTRIASVQDHRGLENPRNLQKLWNELDNEYDRVLLIELDAIISVSPPSFRFRGDDPLVEELIGFFSDGVPSTKLNPGEEQWHAKSAAFGAWITHYHTRVWRGDDSYNPLLESYRSNGLVHYPTNGALFFLKVLPIEQWLG